MKTFTDMVLENTNISISDKLSKGRKISQDDLVSYRNSMDSAFKFDKLFEKYIGEVSRNKIFNDSELKILEQALKLVKYTGKVPMSMASNLVDKG